MSFGMNIRMVLIQPVLLLSSEKSLIDQFPTVWNHGYMFESQIWLVPKLVFGFYLFDHNNVFYPNAELPVLVVSRLIRNHITNW